MSLPHEVVKVTLSGTMFSGQEIWSTGFYLGFENQAAAEITPTGVSDVAAAWQTFFSAPTSKIHSEYTFDMCKMHRVNIAGKTVKDTGQYYSPPTVVRGGYSGPSFPPQVALVATLRNSLPRGLATKGRMFLPGVTTSPDNTGHISGTVVDGIALNLKTFFDAIWQDADLPGNPVLASVGNVAQLRPGAVRKVSQIRVGNVYDTQRRRRNSLMESYTIKPVAGG